MKFRRPRAAGARSRSFGMAAAAIAAGLLAGGCSVSYTGPTWLAGPSSYPRNDRDNAFSDPATTVLRRAAEADGLPARASPRVHQTVNDDPTEPWSPNYGTVRSPRFDPDRLAAMLDAATAPAAKPPQLRPRDPNDIIRQAIAEHEMRRN